MIARKLPKPGRFIERPPENSVGEKFRVTLNYIGPEPKGLRFRVAFDSSPTRWLLPYPNVTGLRLIPIRGDGAPEWMTRYLITEPQDEFVLNPADRIAFDLLVRANSSTEHALWTIHLSPAEYAVRYICSVDPGSARYDYLGRGSRFADLTPPWSGVVESNEVRVQVLPRTESAKGPAEPGAATDRGDGC
jgi:hypothetical protein